MKIIAIITTKNRIELFERALLSVSNQTRKPDELIVVSDSISETQIEERQLANRFNAEWIKDVYTHNYAGSINSAIHYILRNNVFSGEKYEDTYIALLDDDDIWLNTYLEECEKSLNGEDFVVSGLVYCNESGRNNLSIPKRLTIDSFLKGNPHIQGSNTFVKLSTLLKAGLFDENMSSTTDRDIFTRLMLLDSTYAICDKYLVEIDAYNSRERITNGKERKAEGLRKFYYKYNGYMSKQVKDAFFERAKNLFGVDRDEIENILQEFKPVNREFSRDGYSGNLTFGFIATEYKLGLRLLSEIVGLKRKNTQVVILINFIEDRTPYINLLEESGYRYVLIDKDEINNRLRNGIIDQFVTEEKLKNKGIKDIAVARTILQKYLYEQTCGGDVIWVLDEDMELKELIKQEGGIEEQFIDIDSIISTYKNDYDAVIGNYSLDAPLPTLSTIRVSLLDYVYNTTAYIGETNTLYNYDDYYYDLSDCNRCHLETPVELNVECSLDDIFSGKAQGRPLFINSSEIKEVKSRGGNTLIFNRKLLETPNWSIQIKDKIGRRSDYFWALQAKRKGYKVANVPFATLHNRSYTVFNMEKEEEKLLLDIIGASFTKSMEIVGAEAKRIEFYDEYKKQFINRLVQYTTSFYRVNGLLSILGQNNYSKLFSLDKLQTFLHQAEYYVEENAVTAAFDSFNRKLHMQDEMLNEEGIRRLIEKYFLIQGDSLRMLGNGGEGVVFTDEIYVYKVFFKPLKNIAYLKDISKVFKNCEHLYSLDFFDCDGTTVIRYPFEKFERYQGGHAREFIDLLRFCKQNGFVFDNYKQSNFVVVDGKVKLIDYGKSFLPYREDLHQKSIVRIYEMLRYPFLDEEEFKQIIQLSYQNDAQFIDSGVDLFRTVVEKRYKEQLHDDFILTLVDKYTPTEILDYGAGKCKIANELSKKYNVAVFDIDKETLSQRADKAVSIIDRAEDVPRSNYDMVINNLVLCCVEKNTVYSILQNIVGALKQGGRAIISICNPFFNSVQNTELRTCGLQGSYHQAETFIKKTTVGAPVRKEYHRPIEFYIHAFQKYGLSIEGIVEGRGANMDTLMPIAEHLIFDCKKIGESKEYEQCSLLIKTNPMEHHSIYRNIRHIVTTLENGARFVKRVAVVDLTKTQDRARKYDFDDAETLKKELERAKKNGLLDDVIYAEDCPNEIAATYKKYFGIESIYGHSVNGQGLFATLVGLDAIHTPYVFQTDSDIIYHNKNCPAFLEGLEKVKQGAYTATLGIAEKDNQKPTYGKRAEVRTCFLNLKKLHSILPLPNEVTNGCLKLPWHRSLDKVLKEHDSVRLTDNKLWFIHPENEKKQEPNFISYVEQAVDLDNIIESQYGKVNLQGNKQQWTPKVNADVVIYIRGYNTSCEKLKRMFDSLKNQTYQHFTIVYVDDASTNESAEYAKFIMKYDNYFKGKYVAYFNDKNVGELANFVFIMQNVISNKNAIVINLDNDDYLVNEKAIEIIVNEFNNGADVTCGNCIRYDKPLKMYRIQSFDNVWERDGDNIWLHPKCFRRSLFDMIDIEKDLKVNGEYLDVNTDFAFMLPMIRNAKKKVFIEDILYYFEPSMENINGQNKYNHTHKAKIKQALLQKEKEVSMKKEKNQ